ncbi:hypothetical protein X801_08914, partial [Opisthorchis viverrini]
STQHKPVVLSQRALIQQHSGLKLPLGGRPPFGNGGRTVFLDSQILTHSVPWVNKFHLDIVDCGTHTVPCNIRDIKEDQRLAVTGSESVVDVVRDCSCAGLGRILCERTKIIHVGTLMWGKNFAFKNSTSEYEDTGQIIRLIQQYLPTDTSFQNIANSVKQYGSMLANEGRRFDAAKKNELRSIHMHPHCLANVAESIKSDQMTHR